MRVLVFIAHFALPDGPYTPPAFVNSRMYILKSIISLSNILYISKFISLVFFNYLRPQGTFNLFELFTFCVGIISSYNWLFSFIAYPLDSNATLAEHLVVAVLNLLNKEVSEHGRHLTQYFSLFAMFASLGIAEVSIRVAANSECKQAAWAVHIEGKSYFSFFLSENYVTSIKCPLNIYESRFRWRTRPPNKISIRWIRKTLSSC